jgi:hypothetical protein
MNSNKKFYRGGMMDLTDYQLISTELGSRWDDIVRQSPQGTLFCQSAFVSALDVTLRPFYVMKKQETKAAILMIETAQRKTVLHDLVIHNGPMLAPGDPKQNLAQTMSEDFRVLSFLAAELPLIFDQVALATHPDLTDLRPFLWHNYGNDGPVYQNDLRYTAYLDISGADQDGPLNENPTYLQANKSRRQEIRYAQKADVKTVMQFDLELFRNFYDAVFERQELRPDPPTEVVAGVMTALAAAGNLRMYVANTVDGKPGSIAVFGLDERRAYYLYGANDPDLRDGHTGTAVLWDAFRALAQETSVVDLEGVNSPLRGYFKLSFGAELRPYHHFFLGA